MLSAGEADRLIRVERITNALQGTRLDVAYQPIFDLRDGQVLGVEALARFDLEPHRTPDRWFAEADDVGLGIELDMLAVRRAMASMGLVPPGSFLSLNVTPRTLCSPILLEALSASSPHAMVLEAAEALALQRLPELRAALPLIQAMGIRFAIDAMQWDANDVPSLLSLNPDFVKIEMGLCQNIHLDPTREDDVLALVERAVAAGAAPIAVGLQARGEIKKMLELGVSMGQGFFLALPGRLPLPDTTGAMRLLTH
jgi:EAL domain-containing protein (putative c-di-GMP-specific phosphodiesterase class I)